MGTYVADFETTTKDDDCRVWAWATCDIEDLDNIEYGIDIESFIEWCKSSKENHIVYFHNLKFDSQFIISYLLTKSFIHTTEKADRKSGTFNTLISNKGMFYQIEVIFSKKGKNINKVIFLDSLKLLPMSVDKIAKSFKLPFQKLDLDYTAERKVGHELTEHEKDYISNDVKIVAYAVKYFKDQGLNKMTIGACALDEYKQITGKRNFEKIFPPPKFHDDVKQSYRGGFTYLNPEFKGKTIGNGVVLDVNSLYPSVMHDCCLPFGTPIFFKGKYEYDPVYPLYTQMFTCSFEIKKNKIPTIQIKHSMFFQGNEYLTTSNDEEVCLCLNSVDMELFLDHYDVYNIEYISGWKFKASYGLFTEYVDKWSAEKIKAKEEENWGMYLISKLFLNSLYGKFGSDNKVAGKVPYLDEDGVVCYENEEFKPKDPIYVAVASFITSFARLKTISSAQTIMDNYNQGKSNIQFVYADTDSLHCYSPDHKLPEGLDISPTKLGAWKYESKFIKAKFLRQKCYIELGTDDVYEEDPNYELKITVAGMPSTCYSQVSFENFKVGASYTGKLLPKRVKGGVILKEDKFTILDL